MTLTKTQFMQFPNPRQFKTFGIWQSFIFLQNTPFVTSVCNYVTKILMAPEHHYHVTVKGVLIGHAPLGRGQLTG